MNRLYAIIPFILLSITLYADNINASVRNSDASLLKLRAGRHPGFLRIVLEGPGPLISKGKITQKDSRIIVNLPDTGFTIQKDTLPFSFAQKKNLLVFSLEKFNKFKSFSLKNPNRLVIDVYGKSYKQKKPVNPVPKAALQKRKKIKAKKQPQTKKAEKTGEQSNAESKSKTSENKTSLTDINKDRREYDFIPDKYKKVSAILKSGKAYAALKELAAYKPDNAASIAAYHFLYGEAFNMLKSYSDAVNHYRMAYIYAADYELREQALFKRAETYQKIGLLYEAKADYLVFIRDFPSSAYIEKAHLKLADTLSEMGKYREAVEHYVKAGTGTEALFGKANAL